MHLFGYDLPSRADRHFNEIRNTNLERNHVVFVAILFSCQGTDVRERAAILPDPHVRVKRVGSTSVKPTRLTRTRLPLKFAMEKISGPVRLCRLQGPGILRSDRHFVNYLNYLCELRGLLRYSTPRSSLNTLRPSIPKSPLAAAQPAVQIRVTSPLPKIPYRSGTSQNDLHPSPIPPLSVTAERDDLRTSDIIDYALRTVASRSTRSSAFS